MALWTNGRWAKALHSLLLITGLLSVSMPALADPTKRVSAFEYDPVSGLLTKEIIEPDTANLCLITEYTYDSFGNKLTATTKNCTGATGDAIIDSRTASTVYDAQGRFPVKSFDALNYSETKVFDGRFGVVTSLTGPNGLTTTWTYDSFGRTLTEARADGTSSQKSYTLCDVNCPLYAKYKITGTQAGSPTSSSYFDMYGRAIQSETQDKDGALVYSRTEYDKLGRTSRSSRPYKAADTIAWTTFTFDKLNRPITTTAPDNTVTTTTYSGLTTVTTNALNQTRTEQLNSQGQTVSVTDANSQVLSYQYDAFGNLTKTTDALGNITTITYDARGRKIAMNDPDQGTWNYVYDALGQLKKQKDAKLQEVSFTYDKLGRMLTRSEPDLNSTWAYDDCDTTLNTDAKCIGKLVKETSDNGNMQLSPTDPKRYFVRIYAYDSYSRIAGEADYIDTNEAYGVGKRYDAYGRVSTLVYPQGLNINNEYSNGYLTAVRENGNSMAFWTANSTDASGNVTQQTYGNNIVTNRVYDTVGRIIQIADGTSGSVSNQGFVYDYIGNLKQRYDNATGLNESFGYDSLNRLTGSTAVSGSNTTSITLQYDAIGNIKTKEISQNEVINAVSTFTKNVKTYSYGIKPHAVTSIEIATTIGTTTSTTNYGTYTYDANGNMISGGGRTIAVNSWNMPTSITGNAAGKTTPTGTTSSSFGFVYNSAHERVKETLPDGTIIYNISPRLDTGIHVEKRIKTVNGVTTTTYVNSLYAGGMPFGSYTTSTTNGVTTAPKVRYFHTDHLGSIIAITDETATVTEHRSYDAWGKRRNINGTSMNNAFVTPEQRHGFTGHEELDDVGLIHMNGRLYDPAIGRFISADPTIQMPEDMQNYNRYSYINNNPLSAVDYSGYGFNLFKEVGNLIEKGGKEFGRGLKRITGNTFLRTVASVAAAYYIGYYDGGIFGAGNAIANGAAGGFAGGLIQGRGDLKVAIQGAITGAAMGFVGDHWGTLGSWENIAGHAAVGCGSAVMGGGSCGSGALAGGFSGAAAPFIKASWGPVGGVIASAVIGGTASVLGGGKFENGAITGAFGYLFNALGSHEKFGGYNPNDVRGGFDVNNGKSLVFNPDYYDSSTAAGCLLCAVSIAAPVIAIDMLPAVSISGYIGLDTAGVIRYVGITNSTTSRWLSHSAAKGTGKELLSYQVVRSAVFTTRIEARVWEQSNIIKYGLQKNGGQLLNLRNEIASKYWEKWNLK